MVARGCAWLPGGWVGNAWLLGACVVARRRVWLGACVVAREGVRGCLGHMWLWGGQVWLWGRACVGYNEIRSNERAVRILLECILVCEYVITLRKQC